MRIGLLLPMLLPAATAWAATSDPVWPAKTADARYTTMLDQSPFALATVVEAPKAPLESFAANWELTGLAKLQDAQGVERNFVTIRSRDRRISFSLFGDEVSMDPDATGVSISSIESSPASRKSTVTLKKGSEFAKVEFGQEAPPMAVNPGQPPANARNAAQAGGPPNGAGFLSPGASGGGGFPFQPPQAQNGVNTAQPLPFQSRLTQVNGLTVPNSQIQGITPLSRNPNGVQNTGRATAQGGLTLPNTAGVGQPAPTVFNNNVPNGAAPTGRIRVINTRP